MILSASDAPFCRRPAGPSQLQYGSRVFPAATFHNARSPADHVLSRHAQGLVSSCAVLWSFVRRYGIITVSLRLGSARPTSGRRPVNAPARRFGIWDLKLPGLNWSATAAARARMPSLAPPSSGPPMETHTACARRSSPTSLLLPSSLARRTGERAASLSALGADLILSTSGHA